MSLMQNIDSTIAADLGSAAKQKYDAASGSRADDFSSSAEAIKSNSGSADLQNISAADSFPVPAFTANLAPLGTAAYPGTVLQGRCLVHSTSLPATQSQAFTPFSADTSRTLHRYPSFPASSQPSQLPSLYTNTALPSIQTTSAGFSALPDAFSCGSGLSCITAQPQLSNDCQSSNNSEDSLLHSITSSPCYQSSYSGSYFSSYPGSSSPVSQAFDNAALLEQTAAMMKTAAAAIQSLQASSPLHCPSQSLPTDYAHPYPQPCFAPQQQLDVQQYSTRYSHTAFTPAQPAPSMPCIGMQALEELMMSDSSVDSSPIPELAASFSAPACLVSTPWQPAASASTLPQTPAKAQQAKRASQAITSLPAAAPQPLLAKPAVRSVTDIPVFDCKAAAAAAAAAAAQHAQQAAIQSKAEPSQQPDAADDLADFDLPLIDDCFLDSMGSDLSSDLDSDLTSGLCFDSFGAFEEPQLPAGLDRSDSSDNLLQQAVVAKSPKCKTKQSKKLKARGGVSKSSAQALKTPC